MRRLRSRLVSALARSPRRTLGLVVRYLDHDGAWPELLRETALDELLTELDGLPLRAASRGSTGAPSLDELSLAIEVGQAVSSRLGRARTCLARSLSRYALLREHGQSPELVVAVEPDAAARRDEAIGHAWVEVKGRPVPTERLRTLVVSLRHPDPARLVGRSRTSNPIGC